MKLYNNPASPFARKVIVALMELNANDQVEIINVAGTPVNSGTIPVSENPLGKLPTLAGTLHGSLYDSRVISKFVNSHFKGNLYPAANYWQVLKMEALADGIMDASVLSTYEKRVRSKEKQSEEWVAGQWSKITRSLDALEESGEEFLGLPLNMAQIALGCALGYLDFRHSDRPWQTEHPKVEYWNQEFSQRASMRATRPE